MVKRKIPVVAIVVSSLALIFLTLVVLTWTTQSKATTPAISDSYDMIEHDSDTAFGGLFYSPVFGDSLRYYEYRKINDSFTMAKNARENENKGLFLSGYSIGMFGVQKTPEVAFAWKKYKIDSPRKYYFSVGGYELEPNAHFFVQNDAYFLAYVKWDSTVYKNGDSIRTGHYERKAIPVRYMPEGKKLLIPVSKGKYRFFSIATPVVTALYVIALLYFLLGLPAQILANISRGRPFDRKNIVYLRAMAIFLLTLIWLKIILPPVTGFFLGNLIPPEFSRSSFWLELLNNSPWFIAAAALLIIGKAFQRGHKLQQEQDLTI